MAPSTPKAVSVRQDGTPDGFEVRPGWWAETRFGETRLVVSAPTSDLPAVHDALVAALSEPIGVLWRQLVDRRRPRPEGAPPVDFVGLDVAADRLRALLAACGGLVWHDARAELWLRGRLGEQVVLDADGLLYCYPDDPSFRDALAALGLPEGRVPTMSARDYVKHWFHAENDVVEDRLIAELGLTVMPAYK